MKIIKPSVQIITEITGKELKDIELAARTCYKSEDKITDESAEKLIRSLIKNGHESMLEHSILSVKFICDRGVSHELVRHRLASFAQESTRYCNYSFLNDGEIQFIWPSFFTNGDIEEIINNNQEAKTWHDAMVHSENVYMSLIQMGMSPQLARTVLPNSVKTEVIMTANYREWRHFFKLRAIGTTGKPHPQMRELALELLRECQYLIPVVFDDIWDMFAEEMRNRKNSVACDKYTMPESSILENA